MADMFQDPYSGTATRRRAGAAAQQATNSTAQSRNAQQFSQPASNFFPEAPPVDPLQGTGGIRPAPVGNSRDPVGSPRITDPVAPPPMTINTDGYAQPAYAVAGSSQAPAGWDPTKWATGTHQTPKYVVGRILSQYAPTVDGLSQAIAEVQRAYPGTTFNGKDKLTIPGVGTIDVLQGASQGGQAWQWLDEAAASSAPAAATTSMQSLIQQLLGEQTTSTPSASRPAPSADPFAATGGGVQLPGGAWVPQDHPSAQGAPTAPQATAPSTTAQTGTWSGSRPVQAPAAAQAPAVPTYQQYNFSTSPTTGTISPSSIASYQGTQAPTYQGPSAQTTSLQQLVAQLASQAAPTVPNAYQAGTVGQFAGGAGADAIQRALDTVSGAASAAMPNVAALKEVQKDALSQIRGDQRDALLGGAAARGTLGSGATLGLEALLDDAFASDLTRAYRDIDIDAQQRGFENQLTLADALANLGLAQGDSARADYASTLSGQTAQEALAQAAAASGMDRAALQGQLQGQQFSQASDAASLLQQMGLADFAAALQGTQAQAGFDQAAASSQQDAQRLLAQLQQQGFDQQLALDQAGAAENARANEFALAAGQQGLTAANQTNQYNLDAAQLLANQLLQGDQLGFDYAQLQQQGALDREQMALQRLLAEMGFDFDRQQLSQQGSQFDRNLALSQAIASANVDQNWWNTILELLR